MTLETKSITELRGIAQAIGLKLDWGWDRLKLMKKISDKTAPLPFKPSEPPAPPKLDNPSQSEIRTALKDYAGIVLTFPTKDTWHILAPKGEDSGSMQMPLKTIINCVKAIL